MKQNKKEPFAYDRTLRDLFQDIPKGLVKLLSNKEAVEFLETKFPKVEEKEADLVVKLEDDTIFHLEIQSTDDKTMPKRMLQYALLIENIHGQFPLQSVLYIGEKEIEIKNSIKTEHINYQFDVKNIKEIDCSVLIESEDINDNVLAILCNVKDIDRLLKRLNAKLMSLDNKKREDYLRKIFYLLRLRPNLYQNIYRIKKEELKMPFIIEKAKDPLYKEGMEIGIEEGIEKGAQQERIALTKSLLKLGVDIKIIKEATGFSEEEIGKIKNSFLNSKTDKT
jgi:predicted transposase/invertase (TIGR01784 family)